MPNRVAAVVTALIALALAVLPVVGNFDWTSTAGCIAGVVAVLAIVQKWLDGYQKHEQRAHEAALFTAQQAVVETPAPAPKPKKKATK